jgi:MFS family permease
MAAGLKVVARNRVILTTSLTEALQYLAFGAVETFLPLYAKSKGVSEWQIGIIFGAQIITLALTKPLSGRQSDRLGRRAVIAAGLGLNALALVGLTAYPSFWGFLAGATLFGLAMSVVTASTSALVADVSRDHHYGTSLGVLSTIMDVGHASGPPIAGLLISLLAYANTYRVLAVLMVVAMMGFLAMTARRDHALPAGAAGAVR